MKLLVRVTLFYTEGYPACAIKEIQICDLKTSSAGVVAMKCDVCSRLNEEARRYHVVTAELHNFSISWSVTLRYDRVFM